MILVVDTVRHSGEHMSLNHEIISSLTENKRDVTFMTSEEYWSSISPELREDLHFIKTSILPSGILGIVRTIYVLMEVIFFSRKFKKIIFLSSITYNTFLISMLSRLGIIRSNIFIFLHEVSYIESNSKSARSAAFFLKLALKIGLSEGSKFIVTGHYILNELSNRVAISLSSVTSIEHPTSSIDHSESDISFDTPITMTSIGVQNIEKNSQLIEELAYHNQFLVSDNKIKFSTVGRLAFPYNSSSSVIHHGLKYTDYLIPRDDFEKLAFQAHFILMFYGKEYDLKTSGVFFDAINFVKPIIALRCNLTEYYFDKFGDIGYLFESLEDMKTGVQEITTTFDAQRYNIQISNLKTAKKRTEPSNFKKDLTILLNL